MGDIMKIAHLSDLHFGKFSLSPKQFFSKEWIGNFNYFLNRRHEFDRHIPFSIPSVLDAMNVTHALISGDLTTTSSKVEYEIAQFFTRQLEDLGIKVIAIPGNHDHYTRKAYREKRFYHYYPSSSETSSYNLKNHGVTAHRLQEGWTLVALDTAIATPIGSANGQFSSEIESHLITLLESLPLDEKIIIMNHFPLFSYEKPKRRLLGCEKLQSIVKNSPNVLFYLHGHAHRRSVADLRSNRLPIVLDCGSSGLSNGTWNLLDIDKEGCDLDIYQYGENRWKVITTHHFKW